MRGKALKEIVAISAGIVITLGCAKTTVRAEEIVVPAEIVQISEELGQKYNICPELIQAICFKESSFRPDAVNGNCIGVMQVSIRWHEDRMNRLGVSDLTSVKGNMEVGVDYLYELLKQYEDDAAAALMKYNGDSRLEKMINGTEDLSEYADEVLTLSAELERRNGK